MFLVLSIFLSSSFFFLPILLCSLLKIIYTCDWICKRGHHHASNCINMKDHNFAIKHHTKLRLTPSITHCWCLLLRSIAFSDLKLWIIKVGELDVCGKSSHTIFFSTLLFWLRSHLGIKQLGCSPTFTIIIKKLHTLYMWLRVS